MANQKHLDKLKQGTIAWNTWRNRHPEDRPDLSGANLIGADLSRADLSKAKFSKAKLNRANLNRANLSEADLFKANFHRADLTEADLFKANFHRADLTEADLFKAKLNRADLSETDLDLANLGEARLNRANLSNAHLSIANLSGADLSGADLSGADLSEADLFRANLSGANLRGANLTNANLVRSDLTNTTMENCRIYGISAWDVQLDGAVQLNLVITPKDQPTITVDNLKIAQFIYLLLNNAEIRDAIDTIARKVVLILGRFTPDRKAILNALKDALRHQNYSPVLFDFEMPTSRNFTETVRILAHLSRFIIADLTSPSSIPHELYAVIPTLAVAVQPLIEASQREYSMFSDFSRYHWVLPIYYYADLASLLEALQEHVIKPVEQKAQELAKR